MRGWVRRLGKIAGYSVLALVLLACLGALWQQIGERRDGRRYPAPGTLVDLGGRRLHLWRQGTGSPVVVMDSPVGSGCLGWSLVQGEVAAFTATCSVDRPGYGWSDPVAGPHTPGRFVSDLHLALTKAGVPPPYIFVGASIGGMDARLFTFRYPQEVAGLVLVDPAHEEMLDLSPPSVRAQSESTGPLRLFQVASRLGILRLANMPVDIAGMEVLKGEDQARAVAVGLRTEAVDAIVAETTALGASIAELKAAKGAAGPKPLGDRPVIVLTRQEDPPPTGDQAKAYEAWVQLHAEMAKESSRGRQVIVGPSGHFIAVEHPDRVVEAIREVVDAVRTSN
jgi:pimeloyl-ACP methyl ester carboxylesterase